MKKFLAITLALIMVLGMFAACSKDEPAAPKGEEKPATTPNEGENNTPTPSTPEADQPDATQPNADKPTITTVTPGKLTMATNAYFPPYEYYDGDKIIGIDAEIAAAIAKELGLELVISDMEFDSIITAVKGGAADFGLAGMTISPDRLEEVDFSISYASGVQAIIVKEGSPIKSVDDLYADGASYKVGVQLGTTGDAYATEDFGKELVTAYSKGNEAVMALLGGDLDCVIIDNEPAKAFVANNTGLVILETSYADEDYAACIAKENTALKSAIDDAILKLTIDGTIDAIVDKYIK